MATRLLFGPYTPPSVRVGDWLPDEVAGLLQVGGWSAGRIAWPRRKKTGKHSLILCGDLVRAVRQESSEAVQYWWGVGPVTVAKWRGALGARDTPGTVALKAERHPGIPHEAAARGRERAAQPDVIELMAAQKRGKPAHPATKAALFAAASAPKPPGWGKRANEWMMQAKRSKR